MDTNKLTRTNFIDWLGNLRIVWMIAFIYVSALTKNIIYVSYLNKKGFHLNFSNNICSIMFNDVIYVGGTLSNEIYVLKMSNPILNVNDNKRKQ